MISQCHIQLRQFSNLIGDKLLTQIINQSFNDIVTTV